MYGIKYVYTCMEYFDFRYEYACTYGRKMLRIGITRIYCYGVRTYDTYMHVATHDACVTARAQQHTYIRIAKCAAVGMKTLTYVYVKAYSHVDLYACVHGAMYVCLYRDVYTYRRKFGRNVHSSARRRAAFSHVLLRTCPCIIVFSYEQTDQQT